MFRKSPPPPSVSLQNVDEVEKVFKRFDANGDGKISSTELRDVLGALGSDTSPEEIHRMMSEIDTDGDGFIDLKEFAEFHKSNGTGNTKAEDELKELKDAFNLYDKDKNGLISAKELYTVLKRLGEKCSLQDCSRMINSVDVDGDGHVNFEEFKLMMTNGKAPSR
ncbi:PREDICTED: probable calcium-binding protein CML23 [Nelumbo nucifera]|uniref:EF-hand domain-containing protein n=2 Tax=Nelumbo nucifera TaxID=4432 RepID=A0A822YT68_NELNU|nr:PREDICTED: probable calcium-binding protein CML23 [Nelumbo nucifera]DAD35690.1 TPA_asm: hypothetical protein HUJ06_006330 [Nelumbo nucifera]